MGFNYLNNISLDVIMKKYSEMVNEYHTEIKTEIIPVGESLGRITAGAVHAKICAPHYNACAMDGIALDARKTFGATEASPVYLERADFIYVDTGDPLPENCDCVIMIEEVIEQDDKICLYQAATPWQHVRQIGEDISAGDILFSSFTKITPYVAGAMLASGILEIEVVKRPIVGIIPTGDEIILPTDTPEKGKIIEFNSTIFQGMIREAGGDVIVYPIVKDNIEDIFLTVRTAVEDCDIVILNAGSSAGRDDYSNTIIDKIGTVVCHGIAIKPGKPTILGIADGKPIIGVPGYPVSGITVIREIVIPILNILSKEVHYERKHVTAVLGKRLVSSVKYEEFVCVKLGIVGDRMIAIPQNRGAGVVSSFAKADGYMIIPQDFEGYDIGENVDIVLLKNEEEIKRTLVVIGSHDPLIEEVEDILRCQGISINISSSHVGSMGGIMAIKRKEAHWAGIHLLDAKTGLYNIPYIEKYFGTSEKVMLLEGVNRIQGIIVAKGNPKNIMSLQDIKDRKLSYVNRQKGSGTRILFDYLLDKERISEEDIYGYSREEYTHTNVAAAIAAGSADAGLGIYSAAKLYDLDFIPICKEEYNILVLGECYSNPEFQAFVKCLESKEFKARLESLKGYEVNTPGRIIYQNM